MDIREYELALRPYQTRQGYMKNKPEDVDPSGNTLLFTCDAFRIYEELPARCQIGHAIILQDLKQLLVETSVEPGLFKRKPGSDEDQKHDDYIGISSSFSFYARLIVQRGRESGWFFDWKEPKMTFYKALGAVILRKRALGYLGFWHGRFIGLTAHYRMCAGERLSIVDKISMYLAIFVATRKPHNESGFLNAYRRVRAMLKYAPDSKITSMASRRVLKQLDKYYGGQIRNVYSIYFSPLHPFALYAKNSLITYSWS